MIIMLLEIWMHDRSRSRLEAFKHTQVAGAGGDATERISRKNQFFGQSVNGVNWRRGDGWHKYYGGYSGLEDNIGTKNTMLTAGNNISIFKVLQQKRLN